MIKGISKNNPETIISQSFSAGWTRGKSLVSYASNRRFESCPRYDDILNQQGG